MILLTGATGFLGKALLKGFSRDSIVTLSKKNADINVDLASGIPHLQYFDMVIHAAGMAHVIPKLVKDGKLFFDVNVEGTQNLLKGLENAGVPRSFIFISSVAVYGLKSGSLIDENCPLLARDAYGLSKIEAEKVILNWCNRNNVICTILRLPLIADQNPPGNLGAMIRAINGGYYFNISDGKARKSIVMAKDIVVILPVVAKVGGVYHLTDGYHPSFAELSSLIAKQLGKERPYNIPSWLGKIIAKVGDLIGAKAPINSDKLLKITSDLTFDDSKARKELSWNPKPVLREYKI